jgi:hypothetical protein
MLTRKAKGLAIAGVAAVGLIGAGTVAVSALAAPAGSSHRAQNFPTYAVNQVLSGANLRHTNSKTGKKEALSDPGAITQYGGSIYAAFQNGVGPQGQASASGNKNSTIVEFTPGGTVQAQWDVAGSAAGLAANPSTGEVVATVNADANSSIYSIEPGGQLIHYAYSKALPHKGGTSAVSFYRGAILVTASGPGTTGAAAPQASYPAVYQVTLDQTTRIASVQPYFYDESAAKIANNPGGLGANVQLSLTDPGSSEVVPSANPRWPGDFVLSSQNNKEQIYSSVPGSLWVLKLSAPVADTAFPTSVHGALYVTDPATDTVDSAHNPVFWPATTFVAVTPCPSGFACSNGYLGLLNLVTGQITAVTVTGGSLQPQGMVFVPASGS